MIKRRVALLETGDLKEDSRNRLLEVRGNIKKIDSFKNLLQASIIQRDYIKTKKITEEMVWEKIDDNDFDSFLNLIKHDRLKSFLHNFEKRRGLLGFSELIGITLRD